ncbi:MAG: hypothetical protein DBX59_03615 [Bacillota bacterium]|nr:MAG: hypothetical protein DBX59_03615 [Bacillota bacterium]
MLYNKYMVTIFLTKCDKSRSHDFLFYLLEKEYSIVADESGLVRTPYGKLALLESNVYFNISHSGDCVAVAICKKHSVGVDIEKLKDADKSKIAKKYFGIEPQSAAEFYTLWTKAESFVKYKAGSIAAELKKIVLDGDNVYYDGELQPVQSKTVQYQDYIISLTSKDTDIKIIDCGVFEY